MIKYEESKFEGLFEILTLNIIMWHMVDPIHFKKFQNYSNGKRKFRVITPIIVYG